MPQKKIDKKDDVLKAAASSNAELLGKVLIFFATLTLTIVALKLTGKSTFKVGDVELSTAQAWIAVLIMTIAHKFCAEHFVNSLFAFREKQSLQECRSLFDELTLAGPLLFRGLMRRHPISEGSLIYLMSAKDPTTWLYYLFGATLVVACVPFSIKPIGSFISYCLISIYLLVWNWLIGSKWSIALVELTLRESDTFFYSKTKHVREIPVSCGVGGFSQLADSIELYGLNIIFYCSGLLLLVVHHFLS
ncbi:MAG: hypothetical protein ACREXW_00595 [Gammaproteobacteria bacterium]